MDGEGPLLQGTHQMFAVVNFINILCALFCQYFGCKKFLNPKHSFVSFGAKILFEKRVRNMLLKLTPDGHLEHDAGYPQMRKIDELSNFVLNQGHEICWYLKKLFFLIFFKKLILERHDWLTIIHTL